MSQVARQPRPKKCRVCRSPFAPRESFQTWCSPDCAMVIVTRKRDSERKSFQQRERREIKVRKEKLKSRADHLREAQAAFNAFIRLRDAQQPCISCGRHHLGKWDAGHYRSVGANPELRFDEDNCHRQCVPCNQHLSGNILNYRLGLLVRIGAERVARLEGPHEALKLDVEAIKVIKTQYRALVRDLKRGRA